MPTFKPIRLTRVETTEIQNEAIDEADFNPSPNQLTEDLEFGIYLYEVLYRPLDTTPKRSLALVLGYTPDKPIEMMSAGEDRWPLAFRLTIGTESLRDILQTALMNNISPVGRVKGPEGSLHRLSQIVRSGEIQLILGALNEKEILQSIPLSAKPTIRDGSFLCIVSAEQYLTSPEAAEFLLIEKVRVPTLKSIFRSTKLSETLPSSLLMEGNPYFVTEHGAFSIELSEHQHRQLTERPAGFLNHLGLTVAGKVATLAEVASWLVLSDHGAVLVVPNHPEISSGVVDDEVLTYLPFRRLFFDFCPSL